MADDAKTLLAARRWAASRARRAELVAARNAIECDECLWWDAIVAVESRDPMGDFESIDNRPEPCWKRTEIVPTGAYDDPYDIAPISPDRWCHNCRERQRIHDELRSERCRIGGLTATLMREALSG